MNKEMRIHTEIGDIIAYPNPPDFPGISVLFKPDGSDTEIDLGLFEVKSLDKSENVDIYVYSDVYTEDYTHRFSINSKEALKALGE